MTNTARMAHIDALPRPFADNAEFLEAKLSEYEQLLEWAALRRTLQLKKKHRGMRDLSENEPVLGESRPYEKEEGEREEGPTQLVHVRRRYREQKSCHAQRLASSGHVDLPFRDMATRCGLDAFDQDVLWLLFFKTVSPDFRQQYEDTELNTYGREYLTEIYIGNLLQIFYPGSLSAQMKACTHFGVDAPLLAHHLVRLGRNVEACTSILEVELQLPQRVVAWIADDNNTYAIDRPFKVERPDDRLERVVLPPEPLDQVLRLIEQYDAYLAKRKLLGLDRLITYGRAVTILEYGPPGTGKTLLARALSNHTGRPLVLFPGSARHVEEGMSSRRDGDLGEHLADLFREAQLQKGIVFIDECEQFCTEDSPELRPLLTELEHTDALVIMATNRPERLALALDRRFTLKVSFSTPDAEARRQIWRLHLEDVPLASDVDLDYLASAYPFAGGYIKNAVLAAVNQALSRPMDGNFVLRQEDIEQGARLQVRHIGRSTGHRELIRPRFGLEESFLPVAEKQQLERLVRIARNYRQVLSTWKCPAPLWVRPECGLKILFYGASYEYGIQATEALAGELGVLMERVRLHTLLEASTNSSYHEERKAASGCSELFAGATETGQLLVITDEWGEMADLRERRNEETVQDFLAQLSACEGIVVVVTGCRTLSRPGWGRLFQESVRFGRPDPETRLRCWRGMIEEGVSDCLDVEYLAREYDLSIKQLQAAVHRAGLLAAAEGPKSGICQELLEVAIEAVRKDTGRQELLFG